MKRAQGKSNLSIVRDYLSGERPFVQCGYDINVADRSRKEGEEWKDTQGNSWVKKNGHRQKISIKAKYIFEERCSICNADVRWGNRLDAKIHPKTGRCYECNIAFESKLRLAGLFPDYETFKVVNNELSALKDMRDKISDSIPFLENYTPKTKDPQFFNEDGSSEFWADDTDRRTTVLASLKSDLILVNEKIQLALDTLKTTTYNKKIENKFIKLTKKSIVKT